MSTPSSSRSIRPPENSNHFCDYEHSSVGNASPRLYWRPLPDATASLPVYQDLVTNDPDKVREIIGSDFTQRTEDMRIQNRLLEILDRLRQGYTGKKTP